MEKSKIPAGNIHEVKDTLADESQKERYQAEKEVQSTRHRYDEKSYCDSKKGAKKK